MEHALSPYDLNFFKRGIALPKMTSVVFQTLWTVNSFLNVGLTHGDFFARNIWLQPIKRKYKYLVYDMPGLPRFFLNLSSTDHYIIKVGDFGETKTTPREEDVLGFFRQTSYTLNHIIETQAAKLQEAFAILLGCLSRGMSEAECKLGSS